jgi:hypothetical protein
MLGIGIGSRDEGHAHMEASVADADFAVGSLVEVISEGRSGRVASPKSTYMYPSGIYLVEHEGAEMKWWNAGDLRAASTQQ